MKLFFSFITSKLIVCTCFCATYFYLPFLSLFEFIKELGGGGLKVYPLLPHFRGQRLPYPNTLKCENVKI